MFAPSSENALRESDERSCVSPMSPKAVPQRACASPMSPRTVLQRPGSGASSNPTLATTDSDIQTIAATKADTDIDEKHLSSQSTTSHVTFASVESSHDLNKQSILKSAQAPQKKSMSISFSTTVKRNGPNVHGTHSLSNAVIEESPIEELPEELQQNEVLFSYPSYGHRNRRLSHGSHSSKERRFSHSSHASRERIPPSRNHSIYNRPRAMSSNISFSTARRCSYLPARDSIAPSMSSMWSYQSKIYQEEAKPIYDAENELVKVSRTLLKLQKYGLLTIFISINVVLIWATFVHYSNIWWFILPILSLNTFTQVIMAITIILTVVGTKLWRWIRSKKDEEPAEPEKIVMLLPCYNEDRNEMQASINSLVRQVKIDKHPRIIMIIVDGNAKSPGEEVSTQDYLLNDLLAGGERTVFTNGYIARDTQPMSVTIQEGTYQGVPYVVIGKARNQGKRDSLCFIRSFMWHYQNQSEEVPTMFDPDLFDYLGSILTDNGLDKVDYLTGMDGDTVFDDDCCYQLVKAIRRAGPKVVGVCGAVLVKFDDAPAGFWGKVSFYLWTLLQNAEYMSTQGLRREFQSRVTGKVNCLPGCCQLIRVSEATFGDEVLRVKFGYVPKPNDLMTQQIMGVYSEDSLHASIIFSLFPESQTAQALQARAFTTVPTSWKVYLSQRKRWALGSLCNESLMIFRRNILWIERISSIITIATWWIGPFIYSSVFGFLISIGRHGTHLLQDHVFAGLIGVILFRYVYTFMIVTWFPHTRNARGLFVAGFFLNLVVSPAINIIVTAYSLLHCDEFSWGKTRITAEGDTGHGGAPSQKSPISSEKSVAHDVERQSPSWQELEEHAIDKFSHRGPY